MGLWRKLAILVCTRVAANISAMRLIPLNQDLFAKLAKRGARA